MLKIENLNKFYLITKKEKFHALKNINLEIDKGSLVAITGKSGAGKSTLLHILACVENFDSGIYSIDGSNVDTFCDKALANIRSNVTSIVLQHFALVQDLSVYENVRMPLYFNSSIKNHKEAITNALEKVDMLKYEDKNINQLSGGQKQRVAIARAIVTNPKYLFADEPTGSLDSKNSDDVIRLLINLNKSGITVVLVTHNLEIANKFTRLIEVSDGKIINDKIQ